MMSCLPRISLRDVGELEVLDAGALGKTEARALDTVPDVMVLVVPVLDMVIP
jgi:hypothetical protein